MRKTIIQGAITLLIFLVTWYAIAQINWVELFKIQKLTDRTEQKLGDVLWEAIKKTERENKKIYVENPIDSIVTHICEANKIDRKAIKVHVINKDNINAFALPNGHLIVYSGLILNSDNQEELTGVLCHEIAHIELNHVMQKLIKEVGLSVLISMTTGNGSAETIKETVKLLSSSALDRKLEKAADIKAVDFLIKAHINPEPFANFLFKLSDKEHESTKYLTWISTHPESKDRANYIIEYSKQKTTDFNTILSNTTWDKLKQELNDKI